MGRDSVRECSDRTEDNNLKLEEGRFRSNVRKFFPARMVTHWHRLLREAVDAPQVFEARLDGSLSYLV